MDVENLRHFKRIKIDLGAELMYRQKAFQVEVKDISLGGAFIETRLPLKQGDEVELRVFLNNPEHIVEAAARVAWVRPEVGGIGIEFANLKPIDVWALMRLTESDPIEAFKLKSDQ